MSFSKRSGTDDVCYTKPLDLLKGWNDHFLWVDTFACPALFPWHTGKSVSRDGVPKSFEFNAEHYATLVAYPAPFHKYPEPFLCLIEMSRNYSLDENTYPQFLRNDDEEMDLLSFIQTADPAKVRVGERERDESEPKLLETTVGRVVSLLPVAPDCSSGDLEPSVDKLFDEGGSGEQADQGDSAGGGHGFGVQLVDVSAKTVAEDVAPAKLQRRKKRKTKVVDAGEPSHPAKKLRGDYGASGVPAVGDSSDPSSVNIAEADVDYVVRTFMPIMTNATTATPTVDPAAIDKEKLVSALVFGGDSSSAGGSHPISGDFSDRTGGDFLVGGIRTVVDPDSNLQRVYIPHWNVTNGFCMDDGGIFIDFNVRAARQISLGAEVRIRAEYNIKEKRRLKFVVEEKDSLLKSRCDEIKSLKAQLLIKEAEAAEAVRLRDEAQALKEHNTYSEKENSELEIKVIDFAASVKVREQEVADLDDVVTSVRLHNDSLADHAHKLEVASFGLQEKLSHYENLTERLEDSAEAAIRKAIEKGMQDGLAAEMTHGVEGRVLADVAAYNPSAEADYFIALQRLQNINFSLLAELRSNKDASIDTIMNILRIEDNLAERLDDYEIAHTEGGEDDVADVEAVADEGADLFPDVSGVELDVSQ
uniref:Transposase (Putative), gypsy type n=1 Tax=Tanacetum cinerariifolium TaxID=118510 RepID=A0A6L2KG91_TANCI|nr:hypothetical protein [Tanacetum cinerariifolium]